MKQITWLEPIKVTLIDGTEEELPNNPLRFDMFLLQRLGDGVFGRDMAGVLIAVKLRALIVRFAKERTELLLEDSDHAMLKQAVEHPSNGWASGIAWALVPFMSAVVNAETVDVKAA